jgi:hypothetical protein
MSSIVSYLNRFHGVEAFERWLDESNRLLLDTIPEFDRPDTIARLLGFKYTSRWVDAGDGDWFHLSADRFGMSEIAGYEYMARFNFGRQGDTLTLRFDDDVYTLRYDQELLRLEVTAEGDTVGATVFEATEPVQALLMAEETDNLGIELMTFDIESESLEARFVFENISGRQDDEELTVNSLIGSLLLRQRQPETDIAPTEEVLPLE